MRVFGALTRFEHESLSKLEKNSNSRYSLGKARARQTLHGESQECGRATGEHPSASPRAFALAEPCHRLHQVFRAKLRLRARFPARFELPRPRIGRVTGENFQSPPIRYRTVLRTYG